MGVAPPVSDDWAPIGSTARAPRIASATSSAVRGKTMPCACPPGKCAASARYELISGTSGPIYDQQPMFRFTVGVEEEFQIIDPASGELRSHVSELLLSSASVLGDNIKRELHQSIVEVGTPICQDVNELREQLFRIR